MSFTWDSTSDWAGDLGLKVLVGVGAFLVYLAFLALVAFLMRPTLEVLGLLS